MLTPGEGAVEQTSVSPDGRFLFYATNAGDIERRHVWKVPTAGGAAEQLTKGETIETYPAALRVGPRRGARRRREAAVRRRPRAGIRRRREVHLSRRSRSFRSTPRSTPQLVLTKAADGTEIHNQLFLPKDLKPGEKRPAIVFVHGGPVRQMLLGYHYMHFYHVAYAVNQWLASQRLRRDVDQLSQRHRLRQVVPHRAEHRRPRQRRVSGRARRRQVSADAAGRRRQPHRHLGPVLRRRAHRAGAGAQLRHLQGRRRSRRRAPVGQLARSGKRLVHARRRSRRSTPGSRRCCSSRETTTATCSSRS